MGERRWMGLVIMLVMGCGLAAPLAASDTPPQTYAQGATRKLGRGIANVATAPLEMIRTPYFVSQRDGGVAGVTVGIVQGMWASLLRELAGVFEVATFMVPIPSKFEPLMSPEFIYAHGDWAP